ncbi:inner membrane protein [Escherichia coli]|uniref:Inner membrane protein n=1 Tax=Escherichia coli TaxID=562 RepID=A0A376S6X8_ECOLX|nr:inner membrane protein [Escherichia coli]
MQQDCPYKIWCSVRPSTFLRFSKAFAFGFVIWLVVHRLLRGWIYAGDIWHPLLMDLSLFAICVCLALAILIAW